MATVYTTRQRLIGERERLEATLAHDRELSDVADLRQLLDETASAVHHVNGAMESAWFTMNMGPVAYRNLHKADQEAEDKLWEAVKPLALLTPRIRLRLGADDAITTACTDIEVAVGMMTYAHTGRRIHQANQENQERAEEKAEDAQVRNKAATETFFAAASERAGTLILPRQ
ncbi:MAG TPA: hypothetical protein VGP18_13330 [Solirubrobacteraceae bacterium]|nr:hypothetical protein [Solirubrobacteraceae bacterium]